MKSLEQQLSEKFDALEAVGKFGTIQEIQLMNGSLEAKLNAADKALRPKVTKHNGAGDNGSSHLESFRESARDESHQKRTDSLKESFMKMGLTAEEAAIAAGDRDAELRAAAQNGDKAGQVYELLFPKK